MNQQLVLALTSILATGVLAQFVAWKLKLPSILLLLISGLLLGPVTGVLEPDLIFGETLFPIVSFAVAIILFEGGLSLKVREWHETSKVVHRLVSVGIVVTFALATVLAAWCLGISWSLAILFGAILTVTGPTVVLPLLLMIKPKGQINSILKWEGILNDPIGALLALLIYEVLVSASLGHAGSILFKGFFLTLVAGGLLGVAGGHIIVRALSGHHVPEFLANSFTLAMVIVVFTISNLIQHESGLFSVTVMGLFVGNQRFTSIRAIIGFKEDLRVLLLSALFIILAARLDVADLQAIGWGSVLFLAGLILIVRPLAVAASTWRTNTTFNEKIFLSVMAPRGIVAAAVSSLFGVQLQELEFEGAELLAPNMFFIIVGTITIYGLMARPLARHLQLADDNPQGCILLGSNKLTRALAKALMNEKFTVQIVDASWSNIKDARMEGIPTVHGNILGERTREKLNYNGIGRFLAMTGNLELNALACMQFSDTFGVSEVYQLAELDDREKPGYDSAEDMPGYFLFSRNATHSRLLRRINQGATIKRTPLTRDFDFGAFQKEYADQNPIPLCLIKEGTRLEFYHPGRTPQPQPGQILISLIGGN